MEEEVKKPIHLLVDNPSEDIVQLSEKLGEHAPVICDDISKIKDEEKVVLINETPKLVWAEKLVGNIHPAHLNHPALEYLIKRAVNGEFSVDISESYESFEKEVYSYRFIDPFEEGEIADIMAQRILDSGFDPLPFRTYFTSVMGYLAHHAKRENIALPIDVQLGIFQGCFVVQVMAGNNSFSVEQIKESFGASDVNNLYNSLLETAYHSTHIMEINKVDRASKLILTGIWCHDQYKLPGGTLLYQNVDTLRKFVVRKSSLELLPNKHQSTFSELKLSGNTARRYSDQETIITNDPALLKKILEHASHKIRNDKLDPPTEISSLKELLSDFEDQEKLSELSREEYENALRALSDISTRELFEASYEYALENLDDDDLFTHLIESANELEVDDVEMVSGNTDEDDFSQLVSGSDDDDDDLFKQVVSGKTGEDKHKQTVKGEKEDLSLTNTVVKGKKEVQDKSKIVIKGGGGDPLKNKGVFNNRLGESSKISPEQLKRATDKLSELRQKMIAVEDIEVAMIEHIIDEVGGSRSAAAEMLKQVVVDSRNNAINKKVVEANQVVKDKLQADRFEKELAKRDHQIERMKSVVEKLQEVSMQKTKIKKNVAKSIDDDDDTDTSPPAPDVAIGNNEVAVQLKTLQVEMASKNAEVKKLEGQLEYFKERSADSKESTNELQELKKQNSALQSQIDLQAARNENMSERMSQQNANLTQRDTSELGKFRERISSVENEKQQLKDQLTRLDFSHRELNKKLQEKENEILRLRQTETSSSGPDLNGSKELEKELELMKQRERTALHEVKAQSLKVRQMEQKLKFAQAQIDKQSSRSNTAASASTGSSNNEKRLEKLNQKLAESLKAQTLEINEKKKEAIKFKAENNQLSHKIAELERQLSKFSKAS